jgi:glycosyltransferase involved in cell wall biosynthesis
MAAACVPTGRAGCEAGLGYDEPMIAVSAVIITFNEEQDLPRTLAALDWADEILVVDSGSTDATLKIAAATPKCRILHRDFDGYGPQKRHAVEQAAHDWVFSVDADEVVSPELADSIRGLLAAGEPPRAGYEVQRRLCFLGREFRFGRESNAPVLRLFDRRRGAVQDVPVHERVEIEGAAGRLDGTLLHYSYRDLDDYFDKFNKYTTAVAHKMRSRGKTASAWDFAVRLPVAFLTYYFVHGNVLNGFPGLVWSILSAYYRAVRYLKLYELDRLPSR